MDNNLENKDNDDKKIDIVSADLLNPFQNVKNDKQVKKDTSVKREINNEINTKEELETETKEEMHNFTRNKFLPNDNENSDFNDFNSDEDENSDYYDDDMDNFYSNFTDDKTKNKKVNKNNSHQTFDEERPDRKSSIIFIIIALVGFGIQFLSGIFVIIGFILCVISFIGSIIMYRHLAKYALLSMIISFILVVASVVMFIIGDKSVDSLINNTKDNMTTAINSKAISFVNAAIVDVYANKTVSCDGDTKSVKYYIKDLIRYIDGYENNILKLDEDNSFVLVDAVSENGNCIFKKYVYLTGENYSFGTIDKPILDKDINSTKPIKK